MENLSPNIREILNKMRFDNETQKQDVIAYYKDLSPLIKNKNKRHVLIYCLFKTMEKRSIRDVSDISNMCIKDVNKIIKSMENKNKSDNSNVIRIISIEYMLDDIIRRFGINTNFRHIFTNFYNELKEKDPRIDELLPQILSICIIIYCFDINGIEYDIKKFENYSQKSETVIKKHINTIIGIYNK